jgi:hypothetical protein
MTGSEAEPTPSAEQAAEQMRDATERIRDSWTVVDLTGADVPPQPDIADAVDSL